MNLNLTGIQKRFKRITLAHIAQSAMAGAYLMLAFGIMHTIHNELAVTSLAASTFIVFRYPDAPTTTPRYIIGGYSMGIICGLISAGVTVLLPGNLPFPTYIPACAVAIFLTIVSMSTLRFDHPPAAALAVSMAIGPDPLISGLAGLFCVSILCLIKILLGKRLRKLD